MARLPLALATDLSTVGGVTALVFSAITCLLWLAALLWARRTQPRYAVVLILATIYCFLSEYLAIRLGKYHYTAFPLSVSWQIPGADALIGWLERHSVVEVVQCPQKFNLAIPVEIAMIEGVLLFSIVRITDLLTERLPEVRWSFRAIWLSLAVWVGKPALDALVAVNLDAVLDPVVSGTLPCSGSGPTYAGLALWTWHTTDRFPGIWFGVPLPNYTAWFSGMFAFAASVRTSSGCYDGCRRRLKIGPFELTHGRSAVIAFVGGLLTLICMEFVLKLTLDSLLRHQTIPEGVLGISREAWQVLVVVTLLCVGLAVGLRLIRHFTTDARFEWPVALPHFVLFGFCLLAIVFAGIYERSGWLLPVWAIVTALGSTFVGAPFWRFFQRRLQQVARPLPE